MAVSTSSSASALAADKATYNGDTPGSLTDGDAAGASGVRVGTYEISGGALAAIIVVVCLVCMVGISTSVLFYVAKKREWTVKETLRRSARKVVTALTPRRTEFPKFIKEGGKNRRHGRFGQFRLKETPPTPRIRPQHLDLEKGLAKIDAKRVKPDSQ